MDNFISHDDALDQEIASKEADIAKSQSDIGEVEASLLQMKHSLEVLSVEVKTLKRAASLRPSGSSSAAARPAVATNSATAAAPQIARYRDVIDQIRAGR